MSIDSQVEEEEVKSASDESSVASFLGMWSDFLQYSFQSLTHTEEVVEGHNNKVREFSIGDKLGGL